MTIKRYLHLAILKDLEDTMVFLGGPRQVGKTTLAQSIAQKEFNSSCYLNWDNKADRLLIQKSNWPLDTEILILDELHNFKSWKRFIKGEYDKHHLDYKFIVTDSARLDLYRKGGDSLQGRYHYFRLHPFSVAELLNHSKEYLPFSPLQIESKNNENELESLFKFGGFPHPLLKQSERELRRWQNERIDRLFKEDIRDIQVIRDVSSMMMLSDLLASKVGSPLSLNSLREDIEVSHRSITNWLNILEIFYYQYRIYPFVKNSIKSLKKEAKLYLWDWSEITDEAARFENLIASHLLKFCHYLHDYEGHKVQLNYIRDINKKEVDFLISINKKPWFAVEVKLNDSNIHAPLKYFKEKLNIPFAYQVVKKKNIDQTRDEIRIISADRFLASLY